jgi:hypothetical protein
LWGALERSFVLTKTAKIKSLEGLLPRLDGELHSLGVQKLTRATRRKTAKVEPQLAAQTGPLLDESMFQQILEAAYVIQEQNEQRRRVRPKADPSATLAAIVEAQEMLRSRVYDLPTAARIIVEHLAKITNAAGIALGVVQDDELEYCAATGSAAGLAGSRGPIGASLSEFLRKEETQHRFEDTWSAELVHAQGADSPIFFPVYHEGRIAGLLQLTFTATESLQDHEIGSCQVMAGLMGEAIGRAAQLEWKQNLAAERASMLEALEQLRPQLERLAVEPAVDEETEQSIQPASPIVEASPAHIEAPPAAESARTERNNPICVQCGYRFGEGENFCGRCGTPRSLDLAITALTPPEEPVVEPTPEFPAQSLLPLEEPEPVVADASAVEVPAHEEASLPAEIQQALADLSSEPAPDMDSSSALTITAEPVVEEEPPPEQPPPEAVALAPSPDKTQASPWGSASSALSWLKSLQTEQSPSRIWLVRHHGDLAVGVSVIVLLFVLTGWGTHSLASKPGQPRLTLFERMLVNVGLAEAPTVPVYNGNPNVSVWVDLHTALYYCPGADLYGKTTDGKFTSQRDAQMDHFESATRKNCD